MKGTVGIWRSAGLLLTAAMLAAAVAGCGGQPRGPMHGSGTAGPNGSPPPMIKGVGSGGAPTQGGSSMPGSSGGR